MCALWAGGVNHEVGGVLHMNRAERRAAFSGKRNRISKNQLAHRHRVLDQMAKRHARQARRRLRAAA